MEALASWIGRQERAEDDIAATPIAAYAALLDREPVRPAAGHAIPLLTHWFYFLPLHRESTLGADGHAERGGFLPPVDLPRRMWAASRFRFHAPVRVGDHVDRVSTIESITPKQGRTAQWRREVRPDPVLLFRYSALTFNSHRIHFDRPYVTEVEGYPGLLVHGPLLGTLLVDGLTQSEPAVRVSRYEFKAIKPVFDTAPFYVCGRRDGARASLWIEDADGALCMDAAAELE